MKKIYEKPEIKAIEVKKEDIITLSNDTFRSSDYMLPEFRQDINSGDNSN